MLDFSDNNKSQESGVIIGRLSDYACYLPVIAKWHYDQWRHLLPSFTEDSYREFLSSHYLREGIPTMFIAHHKEGIIGTAALEDSDMDTHNELSPWLASVYVLKDYRRRGIGELLVHRVIEEADSFHVEKLYLFTADHAYYYKRFGWSILFYENYYGEQQSVMVLNITKII